MIQISTIKLESLRLFLQPLTIDHLTLYRDNISKLEGELKLKNGNRWLTEEFKEVIETCNIPYVKTHPAEILFGTVWIIIHKNNQVIIGDIGFKGAPNEFGLIEIGYGLDEEYRLNGYMTEAIALIMGWAFVNQKVKIILAETDKANIASQKTLHKSNFIPFAETPQAYWWRRDKDSGATDPN